MDVFFNFVAKRHLNYSFLSLKFSVFISTPRAIGERGLFTLLRMTGWGDRIWVN